MNKLTRRRLISAGVTLGIVAAGRTRAWAAPQTAHDLQFILHAVFFSDETHQAKPIDPHVFAKDSAASAGTGPQGIVHASGFRPGLVAGPVDVEIYNAQGKSLGLTLADWFNAKGSVRITPNGAGARLDCVFTGLRPAGVYSLFENHFDQKPIGFTPSDAGGTSNSFSADANGGATISILAPTPLTHDNAVLLVYHSDSTTHGLERGEIGVTAHHQIIARLPA